MGEDKLHEKRLKERARRNGMAKSIDEMRSIVPMLVSATKVYSQAKVVAFALEHIIELQRENADFRQRLGLQSYADDFAKRPKHTKPAKRKEREPAAPAPADERARKRRRLDDVAPPSAPPSAPLSNVVLPPAPKPEALPVMALPLEDDYSACSSEHDLLFSETASICDSLAVSPALSPRPYDEELIYAPSFDDFDAPSTRMSHWDVADYTHTYMH